MKPIHSINSYFVKSFLFIVHKLRHSVLILYLLYNNNDKKIYFAYIKCKLFLLKETFFINFTLPLIVVCCCLTCTSGSTERPVGSCPLNKMQSETSANEQRNALIRSKVFHLLHFNVATCTTRRPDKLCRSSEVTCRKTHKVHGPYRR